MSKRLLNIINKLELSNKDRADFYDELKNIVPTSKPIKTEPYSLLEFIEGSKGQVIKTDLIIDENDSIECDYEMTDFGLTVSGDKFIFNSYGATNSYRVKFSTYSSNKKVYFRIIKGSVFKIIINLHVPNNSPKHMQQKVTGLKDS